MERVVVAVRRVRGEGAPLPLPAYQTDCAAGMDLRSAAAEPVRLRPGERGLIPTGLTVEIPPGFEAQIRPRSGLALKYGVTLLNTPGTIDSDYRGEIQIIVANFGSEEFVIERGDRIAQMVVAPVARVVWRECDQLSDSKRGAGGFGHTGVDSED